MNIPFFDPLPAYLELKNELDLAYQRVMNSGHWILGTELERFEHDFAAYCGVKHCVGVGNGLSALTLLLKSYQIGPGDEVIVPAATFVATWMAVSLTGAVPVPVDVDLATYTIDDEKIEALISSKTKAIIVVHLYGLPANMNNIRRVAGLHGLIVIEDAAQAHGATYQGKKTGSLGHAAAFSFYPTKNLGAFGDAGAILTDDDQIARSAYKLRNYGSVSKYQHEFVGENSRMDELQAAFLTIKLKKLDDWNLQRAELASLYTGLLANISNVILPRVPVDRVHVWHLYVIRSTYRDSIAKYLSEQGISTGLHYPAFPHKTAAYQDNYVTSHLPVTEQMQNTLLSLPMSPHLEKSTVENICAAVLDSQSTLSI